IPLVVRREIEKSTRLTADNTGLNFTVAFDYGGRPELGECAESIARAQPDAVNPYTVSRHLYEPELPPVDLMIRTSGEARISNFLLGEGVGPQLHAPPSLWAGLGADELERAITWWRARIEHTV